MSIIGLVLFKHLFRGFLLLAFLAVLGFGQPSAFHWDARQDERLTGDETLARLRLNSNDKSHLRDALSTAFKAYSEPDLSPEDLDSRVLVRLADLNGDGIPEVIAQADGIEAGCSPTGNCEFWIFRKVGNGYEPILSTEAQVFQILREPGRKTASILVNIHMSAFSRLLSLYRMDGTAYRDDACYAADFLLPDKNGKRKLQVTPCSEK